jgi:glycosyltransferase involved in cell wall biosynthesis
MDVRPFLNVASLFVLPTLNENRKEGCPVSLLEAMASGLNVIASKISGNEDILSEFPENMFEAGNINSLYHAIKEQFNNLDLEKGIIFQRYIKKKYSLFNEVQMHQMVYKSCLKI